MTEHQPYTVVEQRNGFELRRYPPAVLAEVEMSGVSSAFRTLVSYIGGRNSNGQKIAMTAPVLQEPGTFAFVMPAGSSLSRMPTPTDPTIRMRDVGEELVAADRFSGRWSDSGFARRAESLLAAVRAAGLEPTGAPRFARYDPPWTPWFMRRNEVLIPVAE